MTKKRIPNPSKKIQGEEKAKQEFIQGAEQETPKKTGNNLDKAKGYPVSMYPDFVKKLDEFLEEFPEERSRSALLVRGAEIYMRLKREGKIM